MTVHTEGTAGAGHRKRTFEETESDDDMMATKPSKKSKAARKPAINDSENEGPPIRHRPAAPICDNLVINKRLSIRQCMTTPVKTLSAGSMSKAERTAAVEELLGVNTGSKVLVAQKHAPTAEELTVNVTVVEAARKLQIGPVLEYIVDKEMGYKGLQLTEDCQNCRRTLKQEFTDFAVDMSGRFRKDAVLAHLSEMEKSHEEKLVDYQSATRARLEADLRKALGLPAHGAATGGDSDEDSDDDE
jgi:hypothetical protein